jgi:CheY-like chemotaxis protein
MEAVETIRRNSRHLLEIINDILDLSKIEAGKLEAECVQCGPASILQEIASLMRVRAEEKNIGLDVLCDGPVPERINTDPMRLRQILINLIGNAIKFTESGSVRVVASLVAPPGEEPKMRFDVIDTGIGMSPEQIDKLFAPFSQVDSSTSRKYGGTGLGLVLSKRLSQMLGGDTRVQSSAGKGSTFTVTIVTGPLDGVTMLENLLVTESPSKTGKLMDAEMLLQGSRLLLAEDGLDNQRLIAFLLKKAGAEVVVADNGKVAVEAAIEAGGLEKPFDVILMDMQMPVLDGYAATRLLRNADYRGAIIALTAHAMSDDRTKCIEAGCDDYASKPIDRESLIATVARWIKVSRDRRSRETAAT